MIEEELAKEYAKLNARQYKHNDGIGFCTSGEEVEQAFLAGLKAGRPKWHKVADGDLPKENQECYFIYSNTYDNFNKVSFAKSNIQVRTGIYSFFLDEEGNQTTEPCFYDDVIGDEIDLSEVYAWKEIVLPKEYKNAQKRKL